MKKSWWWGIGVILAAAILIFAFWDAISVRLMPKVVLSDALAHTFRVLEARFENSPVHLFREALDPEGCQTIAVEVDTENELLGVLRYNMTVHTQLTPRKVLAEGQVTTGGRNLDLSLFLSDSFAAISSGELVQGNFYGITYDTFPEDIRQHEFLAFLAGDETLSQWENSVEELESFMGQSFSLPEWTAEDIRTALFGVMALKARVGSREISADQQSIRVHTVTFSATGPEIGAAVQPYLDQVPQGLHKLLEDLSEDPESSAQVTFFLHEDLVIRLEAGVRANGEHIQILANLGSSPARDLLTLEISNQADGLALTIDTSAENGSYQEALDITLTRNGVQNPLRLEYLWDLTSGDLRLNTAKAGEETKLRLNLQPGDDGLRIYTQDFYPILSLLTGMEKNGAAICTMTIRPGDPLDTPEYRNLDQWSMEDLLTLLSGFGGLFGLKLG